MKHAARPLAKPTRRETFRGWAVPIALAVVLVVALAVAMAVLIGAASSPANAAPSSPYCGGNHGPRLTLPATVTPKPTNHGTTRPSIPPTPTPR